VERGQLEKYEVTFRAESGNTYSWFYRTSSFAMAEALAHKDMEPSHYPDPIIQITKDFD